MRCARRRIGMIFQEPMTALDPLYPVGEQIGEVLRLHQAMRTAARARVELLARTGIREPERRVDAYPHQLSGGQRQRAMIAMALACRPELLICDEPTTALDVTVQAQILALLDELQAEMGMALLFITHDLNLVRPLHPPRGRDGTRPLVEGGETAEVFKRPQHALHEAPARQPPAAAGAAAARRRTHHVLLHRAEGVQVFAFRRGWFGCGHRGGAEATLTLRRGETLASSANRAPARPRWAWRCWRLAAAGRRPRAAGRRPCRRRPARHACRRPRRRMQVVFQDPFGSLSPRLTVGADRRRGLALHRPELDAAARASSPGRGDARRGGPVGTPWRRARGQPLPT